MHVLVNGRPTATTAERYDVLRDELGFSADTLIVNGHSRPWQTPITDGDEALMFDSSAQPSLALWRAIYDARYGRAIMERLQAGRVAICGLGGLGSLVALELGRLGVGNLLLIDCDRVDATNLARQHYTLAQIGRPKAEALADTLRQSAPLTRVEARTLRLDAENIPAVLFGWPFIAECLDKPEAKALLTQTVLSALPESTLVGASGMAGFASGNAICAKRLLSRFYMVGDGESEGEEGIGLMAPRVGLCASAQATLIMRLLLGETTP